MPYMYMKIVTLYMLTMYFIGYIIALVRANTSRRDGNMSITHYTEAPIIETPAITEDLYTQYIKYIDASPATVQTYTRALRQFFKFLSLNGITKPQRADILAYREDLNNRCKPATVQCYIVALRLFFQWTEQEGLYPDIAKHIKGAKVSKEHKKDYLTKTQVKKVIDGMEHNGEIARRDYAIFLLMVIGGLRDIEIHRANIEDLRTLGDTTVLYLQGKGRQDRTDFVKIPSQVENAIRDSLADRKEKDGKQPLFISYSNNSKDGRLSTRSISGIVKQNLVRAGFNSDRLTAHSLRHTAVTLSLIGGKTLQEVQQFARHSNIATTIIYSHNLERMANNCEHTIAEAIFTE